MLVREKPFASAVPLGSVPTGRARRVLSDIVKRGSIRKIAGPKVAAIHIQALLDRAPSGRSRSKLVFLSMLSGGRMSEIRGRKGSLF